MNPKRKKKRLPPRGKNGRFLKRATQKRRTVKRRARSGPRKTTTRRKNPMARRRMPPRTKSGRFRARRGGGRTTAVRRRRTTYRRRNPIRMPRITPAKIMDGAISALIGGGGVVAGKIVSRQGITLTRQDPNSPIGVAAQLAIAVAAGIGLKMLGIKGPFADGLVYGVAAGAAESALKLALPGQAEAILGEQGGMGAYGLSAYGTGVVPIQAGTGLQDMYAGGAGA